MSVEIYLRSSITLSRRHHLRIVFYLYRILSIFDIRQIRRSAALDTRRVRFGKLILCLNRPTPLTLLRCNLHAILSASRTLHPDLLNLILPLSIYFKDIRILIQLLLSLILVADILLLNGLKCRTGKMLTCSVVIMTVKQFLVAFFGYHHF